MTTKKGIKKTTTAKRKSVAIRALENLVGEPLSFGDLIVSARDLTGMTQTELARELNVTRSHICDLEKGRRHASPAKAAKIANALGHSRALFVRMALQELIDAAGLDYGVELTG